MTKKFVRPFTPAWRWGIALSSVGAFIGGWAVIAHMPNPYEGAAETVPADTPALNEQSPLAAPTPLPRQSTQPTTRQRQIQPVPTQQPSTQQTAPQVQPLPTQAPSIQQTAPQVQRSTRAQRQPRLRSGGS